MLTWSNGPIPNMALLEISHVSKRYGGLAAVDDLSFEVRAGEILGLIGPNGAGKTTLINLITRTEHLSGGEVRFKGQRISSLHPFEIGRLGIARTFQIVRPFRNMTVLENVMVGAFFGASGAGRTRAQVLAKAEEVLATVDLLRKADYPTDSLTVPDRKRLELAKALAMDPELLLLDEVMAGLNHSEIDEVMKLVLQLNHQGMTIVAIEHVMKAIMGISQRVIVLDHGQQIASGAPLEIASNPLVISAYLGKRYAARMAGGHKP